MSNTDDLNEVFRSKKIYRRGLESLDEANDAFEQGFVTAWEKKELIIGNMVIDGSMRLVSLIAGVPKRKLTRARMLEIETDKLLGIGNGHTTRPEMGGEWI